MTGYGRDRFGQAWLDADRNGCDTRNDVLRRDLRGTVLAEGTDGCVVLSGVLEDPYTGAEIGFVRGGGVSVDVDHVVALGDAWSSGAGRLDVQTRAALANDPLELLAVDAGANRSKGDADAASWLPPVRSFRCAYVARQVAVKAKYDLAVTPAEKAAVLRVLAGCPDEPLTPDPAGAPTRVDQRVTDPGASDSEASPSGTGAGAAVSPRATPYARCDDARAAGATPLHRGDPGWSESLDRDHDGTACSE
ncbi:MAG: hypothetical protein JWR42_1135 [Marmoricola sp.]|nr:hypothetical protein [Marmoricola sp.]